MTIDEVFSYIESFTNLERTPGTSMRPYRQDRMRIMLDLYGSPHRAFRVIHIAGSKGKGSTAAYISGILNAAGFKAGLYTSPHVVSYKERFTIAGKEIEDEAFIEAYQELRAGIPDNVVPGLPGQGSPTTFELLTLLSFLLFRRIGCAWGVFETGIGGRLDATNVVQPERTVITPIELEHTELLGTTLEEIAFEKAGIAKPRVPMYLSYQKAGPDGVIARRCTELEARVTRLSDRLESYAIMSHRPVTRVRYTWRDGLTEEFDLGMGGETQAENAALSLLVARDVLRDDHIASDLAARAVEEGLARTVLPGRMELASEDPVIVLDGAHTPSSVTRLVETFSAANPAPRTLIFGSVAGKKHDEMAAILAPHFDLVIVSTPGTFKASDPGAVHRSFASIHPHTILEPDPEEALRLAVDGAGTADPGETSRLKGAPILVTGSFYMISEIRKAIEKQNIDRVPAVSNRG